MARPIRIQIRDTGLGAPPVLPSVGAQTAPARAAGDLARQAGRAVGGVAREVVQRQDNLSLIRQGAEMNAKLKAGRAATREVLDDHGLSDDYDEEGHRALFETRTNDLFESMDGLDNPRVKAALEGQLAGELGADFSGELSRQQRRRDERAVEVTGDETVRFIEQAELEGVPAVVQTSSTALDQLEETNPEMRAQIQNERNRIFQSAQARYRIKDGAKGELRFFADLMGGEFDGLGLDTIGREAQSAAERVPRIAGEILRDAMIDDNYGFPTENGGLFHGFEVSAELKDLDALLIDTENLPEREKLIVHSAIKSAKSRRTRRALTMQVVDAWFEGASGTMPHMSEDSELQTAWNHFFNSPGGPRDWLDTPGVDPQAKAALLVRTWREIGYAPPAMRSWIQSNMPSKNANPDPEVLSVIAMARGILSPNPSIAAAVTTSQSRLAAELQGTALPTIDEKYLTDLDRNVLDRMARAVSVGVDPGLALEQSLEVEAAARDRGGHQSVAQGRGGPGDALDPVNVAKVSREASDAEKALRKRLKTAFGVDVDAIGPILRAQIRTGTEAEFFNRIQYQNPDQALRDASDAALGQALDASPPVGPIFGRTVLSKPLSDLTEGGRFSARMIEMELEQALTEAGEDPTRSNFTDRVRLIQPPGANLAPNEFWIQVEGTEKEAGTIIMRGNEGPQVLRIDGDDSVFQRAEEELRMAQLEHSMEIGLDQPLDETREDLIQAFLLNREDWNKWASPNSGYVPLPPGMDTFYRRNETPPSLLKPAAKFDTADLRAARERSEARLSMPKAFESTGGRALLFRSPTLKKMWERSFKTRVSDERRKNEPLFDGPIPVMRRQPLSEETINGLAIDNANTEVLQHLRSVFGDAEPAAILRAMRLGVLPSEEKPDATP